MTRIENDRGLACIKEDACKQSLKDSVATQSIHIQLCDVERDYA